MILFECEDWVPPIFSDTSLSSPTALRTPLGRVDRHRVPMLRIVEALDVIEDVGSNLAVGSISGSVDLHNAVLPAATPERATDFLGFWAGEGSVLLMTVNNET